MCGIGYWRRGMGPPPDRKLGGGSAFALRARGEIDRFQRGLRTHPAPLAYFWLEMGPAPARKLGGGSAFALRGKYCADRFQCSLRPDPAAGGRSGNGAGEGTPILDEGHTQRCRLSDRTVPSLQRSSVHRLVGHDSDLIAVRKSFAIGGNPFTPLKF